MDNSARDEKKPVRNPLASLKGYPDVFDDFDCRPENSYPEADRDAVTPEHIKKALADMKSKTGTDASND